MTRIKCFKHIRYVRSKKGLPSRIAMELISRGGGTVLYRSKACFNEASAEILCDLFLTRNKQYEVT